ncbi:hypothetical protein Cob_v011373 [Colletotrichum orbiculare MAFF 240422]|uniref:Uncharacterized protein n=1 Tax=Colletotrichum orbiculare (strain 104-T / ATCC 96160 / CBS 514.97 / LARS 414 / MAFF 240422) TaxID=1213857 RepID=A0A484FDE1_COLOR|nr:hypothetical protein Cob_v011373 [Colletotrichum orbiculare MAFF 240422]
MGRLPTRRRARRSLRGVGGAVLNIRFIVHVKHVHPAWSHWEHAYFDQIDHVLRHPDDPAKLVQNGCRVGKNINCRKACDNATLMFRTPQTLWNCVTLATLAVLTGPGPDSINETQVAKANRLLNFGNLSTFDYPFGKYRQCAFQSCSTFGGCSVDITEFLASPINISRVEPLAEIMHGNYCTSAQPGIDFDIAGPGVVIAYFVQFALVFFFAICFTLSTNWMNTGKPRLLSKTVFAKAIAASITDLQETQAAFLVTVAAAAIATFLGKQGTGLANIPTVESWITNDTILKGVVAAGSYPLLLVQLALHASGSRWWYTLLFVGVNLAMVRVMHTRKDLDPDALLPHFRQAAEDLTGCGNQAGPRTFCRRQMETRFFPVNANYPHAIYIISAFLLLDWAVETSYNHARWTWIPERVRRASQHPRGVMHETVKTIGGVRPFIWVRYWTKNGPFGPMMAYSCLWALLELTTLGMCILAVIEIKEFLRVLRNGSDGGVRITRWAFGQLVAVAVWFPIVLKFFSLFLVRTNGQQCECQKCHTCQAREGQPGRSVRDVDNSVMPMSTLRRSAQRDNSEEVRHHLLQPNHGGRET